MGEIHQPSMILWFGADSEIHRNSGSHCHLPEMESRTSFRKRITVPCTSEFHITSLLHHHHPHSNKPLNNHKDTSNMEIMARQASKENTEDCMSGGGAGMVLSWSQKERIHAHTHNLPLLREAVRISWSSSASISPSSPAKRENMAFSCA